MHTVYSLRYHKILKMMALWSEQKADFGMFFPKNYKDE